MSETTTPADASVFQDTDRHDIELTETDLLGTHTYRNVLYTGEIDVVDVTTNETPERLQATTERAKAFAAECGKKRVAKKSRPEAAIETGSAYSAAVFYHMGITGNMQWHTIFRKACESDAYNVAYDTNYTTGTLTITVKRSE